MLIINISRTVAHYTKGKIQKKKNMPSHCEPNHRSTRVDTPGATSSGTKVRTIVTLDLVHAEQGR